MRNKKTKQAGVAILFSILLVSVVLTISLTLLNIAYRQIVLSSVARESEVSFSAADAARNCARYWDRVSDLSQRPFGYYDPDDNFNLVSNAPSLNNDIECGGSNDPISVTTGDSAGGVFRRNFTIWFNLDDRTTCAKVEVIKKRDGDKYTIFEARGYNLGTLGPTNECPSNNASRLVERAIRTEIH